VSASEDSLQSHPSALGRELARAKGLIQNARFAQAESLLLGLLGDDSDEQTQIECWYALAVARRYRNDHTGALQTLEKLHAAAPRHARAHQEVGHNLLALNRPEAAAAAFARAVDLNAGLLASWKALANLHRHAGRPQAAHTAGVRAAYLESLPAELRHVTDLLHEGMLYKAEQLCRHFLKQHKQHIEGMRLLAEIGVRLKVYDDAEFLLESAVEFAPDHLGARSDYLKILNRKGKFAKAYEQARLLHEADPDNPGFKLSLANGLTGLGRIEEGIDLLRECLDRVANKAGVHILLGHAHKSLGKLDDAIAAYREAYRARPDYGDAFWSLANTKTYRFTDAEIAHIKDYEARSGTAFDDRVHLCFAAGKALEDRSEYRESFEYYARGNALKQQRSGYDPAKMTEAVEAQVDVCTPELFERRGELGFQCPDPIFIVGLPRAGSTLLEQILASHSMVDGTMELHDILSLVQRLRGRTAEPTSRYPRILWELEDSYFERFGQQFIDNTRAYRGGAPLFIDKMPNNFMHVGLIRLILPGAKIIDARRSPMACCFSGFKQLFGEGQEFTYGLESIGLYYRDYVRLMDHWDEVLPGFVLRVMHEDVVADLDGQVRRLLDFCGLPFEERCLRFHETARSVRTPSSEQVRQPIYQDGLAQWRHFEAYLEPLKSALGPEILARYPDA